MAGQNAEGRGLRKKRPSQKVKDILESEGVNPNVLSQSSFSHMTPSAAFSTMTGEPSAEMPTPGRPPKRAGPPLGTQSPSTTELREAQDDNMIIKLPTFSKETTRIYAWPYPQPTSFVRLKPHECKWKENLDAAEKSQDLDEGLEDWEDFAGPFDPEGGNRHLFDMAGSVFIKRAKRAYWTGKAWERFEQEELSAKTDEYELPNTVRLTIFNRLKRRLCEEIWSHALPAPAVPDSKVPSPKVAARQLADRSFSTDYPSGPSTLPTLSPTTSPTARAPAAKRPRITPPNPAQRASGIPSIHISTTNGVDQPLYESEIEQPRRETLPRLIHEINGALARAEFCGKVE